MEFLKRLRIYPDHDQDETGRINVWTCMSKCMIIEMGTSVSIGAVGQREVFIPLAHIHNHV